MRVEDEILTQLDNKFKIIKLLGQGAFGNVYQCQDRQDFQKCAVKVISKINVKRSKIQTLKEEAKLLKCLQHKNIVKIYQYGQFQSCIFIKMEIAKTGTLQNLIEKRKKEGAHFTDEETSRIICQILSGLCYIHSLNIIHRDIKPQNILLTQLEDVEFIKIADFGLSTKLDFHYPKSAIGKCGTMLFMAPEILCKYAYTKAIDIWSTAIIMYIMLVGNHPIWKSKMTTDQYNVIISKTTSLQSIKGNGLAQDFFSRISKVDPKQRYTAQECLKHPWITRKFQDQIPLSVHESYSSFSTANETLIKIYITLKKFCKMDTQDIPKSYTSKLSQSPNKQLHSSLRLKKLKSLNMDKDSLINSSIGNTSIQKCLDQRKIQSNSKLRIISQSDVQNPTINKLNQIFNTLFDKKITSRSKMTFRQKQAPKDNIQQVPNIDSFKKVIELEIERSVLEYLESNKNKNRRILPLRDSPNKKHTLKDERIDISQSKGSFIRKAKSKKKNNELFKQQK